jgi:hypothetical protein
MYENIRYVVFYLLLGETVWQHVRDGAYPACGGGQPLHQTLTREFHIYNFNIFVLLYFLQLFTVNDLHLCSAKRRVPGTVPIRCKAGLISPYGNPC